MLTSSSSRWSRATWPSSTAARDRDAGGQPPPGPPFGQLPQPDRLDPGEPQPCVTAGEPEPAQQPDVVRELGVPANALDQITQISDRVQQEPALDMAALAGEAEVGDP